MYVALVVNYLVLFCTFKVRTKFIFTMDSRRLFTEWISNQTIEWVHAHCTWKLNHCYIYCKVERCFSCHLFFLNMHVNNDSWRYLLFYNQSVTALFIHDFLRFRNNSTTDTDHISACCYSTSQVTISWLLFASCYMYFSYALSVITIWGSSRSH